MPFRFLLNYYYGSPYPVLWLANLSIESFWNTQKNSDQCPMVLQFDVGTWNPKTRNFQISTKLSNIVLGLYDP
jgi:hypothetical protein